MEVSIMYQLAEKHFD